MRAPCVVLLVFALAPAASAQSISIQAAAGPTLVDTGHHVSASLGVSALSRLTFLVDVERTVTLSTITQTGRVTSGHRGGTLTAVSGEVRASLFGAQRVTPYVLAGYGGGKARPNVNEDFPGPVNANDARFMFFGGGVDVPLGKRLSLLGDVRWLIGEEEGELLGLVPVRVGIAWHF